MFYKNDGDLDDAEYALLRQEFEGSGITVNEHEAMLAKVKAEYLAEKSGTPFPGGDETELDVSIGSDPILLGMSFFSTPYKPVTSTIHPLRVLLARGH